MSEQAQAIENALKTKTPQDVVHACLINASKPQITYAAQQLVAIDATDVSLNFSNPELKQIEPWADTFQG